MNTSGPHLWTVHSSIKGDAQPRPRSAPSPAPTPQTPPLRRWCVPCLAAGLGFPALASTPAGVPCAEPCLTGGSGALWTACAPTGALSRTRCSSSAGATTGWRPSWGRARTGWPGLNGTAGKWGGAGPGPSMTKDDVGLTGLGLGAWGRPPSHWAFPVGPVVGVQGQGHPYQRGAPVLTLFSSCAWANLLHRLPVPSLFLDL